MEQMIAKAKELSAEELKKEIAKVMDLFDDVYDLVLKALIAALESKVPESEFISFLDAL